MAACAQHVLAGAACGLARLCKRTRIAAHDVCLCPLHGCRCGCGGGCGRDICVPLPLPLGREARPAVGWPVGKETAGELRDLRCAQFDEHTHGHVCLRVRL
eukprot:CAMPEP_0179902512 /NCGR_PEP_ID=MMETSP0982-20121206/40603_1 /TAXON_ID=483367 /ORGANISM="non described non described, Strain CCMP 2436" /LENGTH=100 /DNA_ID=CAMNT_0021801663 /DNA_START=14 /DNA_END=313 /DNA_ORIENTATION=+